MTIVFPPIAEPSAAMTSLALVCTPKLADIAMDILNDLRLLKTVGCRLYSMEDEMSFNDVLRLCVCEVDGVDEFLFI
jgi:hypothetical protein